MPHSGSYKLQRGQLRPYPRGSEERFMLVRAAGGGVGCRPKGEWGGVGGTRRGL